MGARRIKRRYRRAQRRELVEEYMCSCLLHLFCNLCDVSLLRLLRKFKEKDCAKVDRLVALHTKYWMRSEARGDERFGYEDGLYALQMADLLIAFVYTFPGEPQLRRRIEQSLNQSLNQSDMDIDQVKATLRKFYDVTHARNADGDGEAEADDGVEQMSPAASSASLSSSWRRCRQEEAAGVSGCRCCAARSSWSWCRAWCSSASGCKDSANKVCLCLLVQNIIPKQFQFNFGF